MKNIVLLSMCFFLFITIITTGFYIVDKSFNTMMISDECIRVFSLNVDENGYLKGNILNEPFSLNVKKIVKNLDDFKESVIVYVEKIGNSKVKNII